MGIRSCMSKQHVAGAAALILLASTAPAFAQDRDYNRDYNHDNNAYNRDRDYNRDAYRDRNNYRHYDGDPHRFAWQRGDYWRGHRVAYRNGAWGYWEPRNGA